jgi:glycosyltransferase involved in cell wall biosynthesis
VVANSQAAAAQVVAEGVPAGRVSVIPNGVDLARYGHPRTSAPASAKASAGRPSHPRTITTVANLRAEKGHDVLLDAAAQVVRSHPDVLFQCVGDGPMRAALEEQARRLGIARHVAFLGHREDVPELLARSTLFVLPSRSEAFPNGLVEAMAAGVPSIASGVGGILELVQHQQNGLLAPVGDAAALACAIVGLLDDPALAHDLGTSGRRTIAARYSFDRMVSAFEALYLGELAGSRFPIHALCAR